MTSRRANQTRAAYTSAGTYRPPRDRRVQSISIDCPQCQAPAGQQCRTAAGTLTSSTHIARRRMALRAQR